ncbi:MAG: DUF3618 domain-containing protein [Propionibacteriaceae bacterium]
MSNDPDQIRADIEATRQRLSNDVDTLTDEANPKTIAKRKVDHVKEAGADLKDKIMGSADDARGSAGDTAASLQSAASDAPGAVKQKTRGNPLAAGLVAFGLGALIAGLIPASDREQQAAADLKANIGPVKQQVTDIAKDAAANLKEPAQDAAESVKATATDAAETVKSEGQSAAEDVQGQAQASKASVQDTRG